MPTSRFTAVASTVLVGTTAVSNETGRGEVRFAKGLVIRPQHDAAYWEAATAGFDFSEADQVPPALFNRVLWAGLMGNKRYPAIRGQLSSPDRD